MIVRGLLSLLPNRMARVCASGSPSETSAATFQTQERSLPTFGDNFMSGVTATCQCLFKQHSIGALFLTIVIGADLEGFVSSHNQASLAILFVLQQTHIAGSSLLPLSRLTVKLEELGSHLEHLLLGLFVRLGLDFLGQVYDWLKVNIGFLLVCFVLHLRSARTCWYTSFVTHIVVISFFGLAAS